MDGRPDCIVDGCNNVACRKDGRCRYCGKPQCSVDGCLNRSNVRGMCNRHAYSDRPCTVDGCDLPGANGRYCSSHATMISRTGVALPLKGRGSVGERMIADILDSRGIGYEREFSGVACYESGLPIRWDFHVPHLKLLIEFDGAQHYREMGTGRRPLGEVQERDRYRSDAARQLGFNLVRIPYFTDPRTYWDIVNEALHLQPGSRVDYVNPEDAWRPSKTPKNIHLHTPRRKAPKTKCLVCEKRLRSGATYCTDHRPTCEKGRPSPIRDFMNLAVTHAGSDCLEWIGSMALGIPTYTTLSASGVKTKRSVRRYIYTSINGEVGPDYGVYASCGDRKCVNPGHLVAVHRSVGAGPDGTHR